MTVLFYRWCHGGPGRFWRLGLEAGANTWVVHGSHSRQPRLLGREQELTFLMGLAPAHLCRAVGEGSSRDWELVLPGFGEGAVPAAGWHFFEVSFYLKTFMQIFGICLGDSAVFILK